MTTSSPPSGSQSPHRRILAVALVAGGLVQLILSASAADAPPGAAGASPRLERGKPIERQIGEGETHVYEVVVPLDRVVSGVVDQRGIDLAVRIVDPAGRTTATVDSPNGTAGPEPWTLQAKPGTWRIEVSPLEPKAQAGRYEARIDDVITVFEHAERQAKQRYQSPRMLKLWKEHYAGGAAVIERFAKEMEGHAPLVEPLAEDARGDVLVTFFWRAPAAARDVWLVGFAIGAAQENLLVRFEDTDLLYLTARVPKDSRFTYSFRQGEPLSPGATWKQAVASSALPDPDPWNPRRFFASSLVELPGAPPQAWAQRAGGVPEGRVADRTIHSEILGEDRKLGVYLPPSFNPAAGPYPYVAVLDGEMYGLGPGSPIPTPVILDNLIAQGKVPPMLGVLVANQGTRNRDLTMSAPFCDFLAKELVPWLRREYRAAPGPARATLAGASFGGLCAAYCALQHPEAFGNVLSQSGSFWFSPGALQADARYHVETGGVIREVLTSPPRPLRFWMEVGIFEGAGGLTGGNQVAQNRHMRDVLIAKGYDVSYREYSGGHDTACWRGSLADGLMTLAAEAPGR